MKWRRTVRVIHRDVGFVIAALTIIYSLSGIAVNHINDWNPNYVIEIDTLFIEPITDSSYSKKKSVIYVLSALGIDDSVKSSFRQSPVIVDIFFEKKSLSANLAKGIVKIEKISDRSVFKESNFLHLNTPKRLWTWIADIFAVALILLAVTGLMMNKGKNGFRGRGKWFFLLGIAIPLFFLLIYY